jgi:arylsulfatase A-like enzyme
MPTAESFKEAGKGGGLYDGTIDLPTELTPAGFVAGKTIELLREFNENPFFLVSSFWGPHHPSLPSPEFAGTHDPDSIGEWKNYRDELAEKPRIQKRYRDQLHRYLTDAPWEIWQKIIAGHFDFMSMIDQQIGRILDELQKLGQEEDTLIIFVADHGDTLGCHGGQWDKGPYMYEETYRIPMIIRPPRPREATRNSSLVSNMDLFSTVLDFCGVQPPSNVDSRSLIPIIEGNKEAIRESVLGQFYGFDKRGMNFQRMLRKGDYKYVYNPSDIDELYDLESDPHELANLINRSEKQEFASDMKQTLYEEMKKSGDPFADEACHLMGLSH